MTRTIQNYIMAIILAGAMLLTLGVTLQTVYAEGEGSTAEYNVDYSIDGIATNGCVLADNDYTVHAILKQNGQEVELPEGATVKWSYGVMDTETIPADFTVEPADSADPTVHFPALPEGEKEWVGWMKVEITIDGNTIESDTNQIGIFPDFYEIVMPVIEPFMWVGDKTTDQKLGVLHHTVVDGEVVTESCDFTYAWRGDDIFDALDIGGTNKLQDDGLYHLTITRLSADAELDFALSIRYTDAKGEKHTETMNYWLAELGTDLSKSTIQITKGSSFTVYEDNWIFVDDVNADPAKGVSEENIKIVSGELEQQFDPEIFEITGVKKYTGYNESTGDDIWVDASFPLTFDKKGSKDRNGNRTDGTSVYQFKVKAKDVEGNRWTGETEAMYLFVNSKYSLYNLKDYFVGTVEFPSLARYLKSWTQDPYERYNLPKSSKAKRTLVIKIGNDKLTPGKQVTVKYVNDKTKKSYNSFPTALGEYTVVITGKAPYFGTDKSTHLRLWATNPLKVKGKTVKFKIKQIKKKAKVLAVSKVIKTVKKGQGKVTYKKLSGNKKIVVASNGKVTVKKGLKKGTYKVKVRVRAAGNDKYNPITRNVVFKIIIKK